MGGIPAVALGRIPVAIDTFTWRMGGTSRLTVIVKADFTIDTSREPSGPIAPTPTTVSPRYFPQDVHFKNQPMAHVVAASDRVPWKTNIDVTLIGHARAAFGRPLPEVGVRFAAMDGATALVQKKARAVGKRASADSKPEPFVSMPVVYERAYGGPSTPTNPIGVGDDEDDAPPNIVDADNPWRPVAFGPIAAGWPLRHRKLGAVKRRDLEEAVVSLPTGFDVSYFQSAPADMQFASLAPTTTFVLEGFHAERRGVEIALPKAGVAGAVWGLTGPDAAAPLAFRIDTIHIDADHWKMSVVFRACVDLPQEGLDLIVAAGLGMDGQAPSLPAQRPRPEDAMALLGARPVAPRQATGTMDISAAAQGGPTLPFGAGAPPEAQNATLALALDATHAVAPLPFAAQAPPNLPVTDTAAPSGDPVIASTDMAARAAAPPVIQVEAPAPKVEAPASTPAAAPKDPYGQAMPWARGAEAGVVDGPAPKPAPAPARRERKFTLRKGFVKR